MDRKFAVDVLFSLCSATLLLTVVVFDSRSAWGIIGGGAILAVITLRNAAVARLKNDSTVKWISGFTDWFIVGQSLTSAVGAALMNIFRQEGWYTINTHMIIVVFLVLNIAEALTREFQIGLLANASAGVGLILTLPFSPAVETISRLSIETKESHCFVFPLQIFWVIMYTSWNACLVYGDNMSIHTLLILIPPIFVMYFGTELWLGARVLLLLTNLILRHTQIVWIYRPGHSALTPMVGTTRHSKEVARQWGRINLFAMCVYFSFLTFGINFD